MNIIVFSDQPTAVSYSASIDGKLGLPKAGIDIGGGIHAPASQSVTVQYGAILKHPTLTQWGYSQDATVLAQAVALPIGATVQLLDATWIPAVTSIAVVA